MYRSGQRPWRKGAWLVEDEESGVVTYSDKVTRDWKGFLVRKRFADYENPQDFVKGLKDPKPIPFSHPPQVDNDVCNQFSSIYVGNTTVTAKRTGAADHLFEEGIGEMEIGCSFIIYPES